MICFPRPLPLRKAKENMFGQNRSSSNGHVVFEKQQQWELDSVVEETVTGDYALIINGHSLVSALKTFVLFVHPDNCLFCVVIMRSPFVFSKQMALLETRHTPPFPVCEGKGNV